MCGRGQWFRRSWRLHLAHLSHIKKNCQLLHFSSNPCFRSLEQNSPSQPTSVHQPLQFSWVSNRWAGDTEQNIRRERGSIHTSTKAPTCLQRNLSTLSSTNDFTDVGDQLFLICQIKENPHLLHFSSHPSFRSLEQNSPHQPTCVH